MKRAVLPDPDYSAGAYEDVCAVFGSNIQFSGMAFSSFFRVSFIRLTFSQML